MLTETQKRLHQQALTILTQNEALLELMQEYKKAHDESKSELMRGKFKQFYDNSAAKRMANFLEYNEVLKQIMEPFEKDLHAGEEPQPMVPKISAVQLAESFYNTNDQPCHY